MRQLHSVEVQMAMQRAVLAAVVAGGLSVNPAMAQSEPGQSTASSQQASLSHSALKATTFKVGTVITNLAVLSVAAGGLGGGAALTTFITASSWVIYTSNDYLWDTYAPAPVKHAADQAFDTTRDVWRNTEKYLTYKPVIASLKLASLYVYTGSASIALVFGAASVMTNTVVFYANNVAWDYYDWYAATPRVPASVKTAVAKP